MEYNLKKKNYFNIIYNLLKIYLCIKLNVAENKCGKWLI